MLFGEADHKEETLIWRGRNAKMSTPSKDPVEFTAEEEKKNQAEPLFRLHPVKQGMKRSKLLH